MARKLEQGEMDLYYQNQGQAQENIEVERNKKTKQRGRRIKENKKKQEDAFDLETETVLQMTNKNKLKKEEKRRRELSQKEKKRKKRIKRIKFISKIVLFVVLFSGVIIFALTSPIFNIKDIEVLNNSRVPSDTIISLSELRKEQNIFQFYKISTINKIKEEPYIENVKIHRRLPGTIEIEVEERIPKYSVSYMEKYAYINSQGYILEISEENGNLPIIQGIETKEENVVPLNRLNDEDLSKLEDVIKIMSSAKENSLDQLVTSIDISNKNNYSIYLEAEKKKIYLGDTSNLSNKMLYILAIIEQEKGKDGDIFVNGDLNNKFQPYFRERV